VSQVSKRARRLVLASLFGLLPVVGLAVPTAAAGNLTMTARVLLQGHARVGSWMAIEVKLENNGPSITGELRMDPGATGSTRFSLPVELPNASRLTYVLHAQPPAFGRSLKIDLISSGTSITSQTVAYLVHDAGQLVVGVFAEKPQAVVGELNLPPSPTGAASVIVPLTPADLPYRLEGWGTLDRLIWQDVDSNSLTAEQIAALRGWISAGGRLVIVGGTAGLATLSALPDDLLPFRPTSTIDLDASKVTGLVGPLPAGATALPALAGTPTNAHVLLASGDRAVAAELPYGSGTVTLVGFDPTTPWLAQSKSIDSFWRGLLPARSNVDGTTFQDDTQLLTGVQQLQSLALPPTGGLLILLAAYIFIVGPINYLVLRRVDRRELAWISVPVFVIGFAAAAYGYGSLLRGSDILVNELAVVRGAPDATEGRAQDYFGVFSPTRSSFIVQVPGALLAAPISGDPFGNATGALDIVQGDPAEVRDLTVGTAGLRTIRAETPASVPKMRATLKLSGSSLSGTFENESDEGLEQVAIVLGSSVAVLGDVPAHASVPVSLVIQSNAFDFGMPLANQIVGDPFGNDGSTLDIERQIRYALIGQLSFDPMMGMSGSLSADQPVILAFGHRSPIDIKVENQTIKRTTNVLYYVPVDVSIKGKVAFSEALVQPTVLSSDSMFFDKGGPGMFNMGVGSVTVAFRPIPFSGTLTASALHLGFNSGNGSMGPDTGKVVQPLESIPPSCRAGGASPAPDCLGSRQDFLPELEIFDRSGSGTWVRLPRLNQDASYSVEHPERYVDPASGQVLLRFVNDNPDNQIGFGFLVSIEGDVQ
jgi:hypothetical protein